MIGSNPFILSTNKQGQNPIIPNSLERRSNIFSNVRPLSGVSNALLGSSSNTIGSIDFNREFNAAGVIDNNQNNGMSNLEKNMETSTSDGQINGNFNILKTGFNFDNSVSIPNFSNSFGNSKINSKSVNNIFNLPIQNSLQAPLNAAPQNNPLSSVTNMNTNYGFTNNNTAIGDSRSSIFPLQIPNSVSKTQSNVLGTNTQMYYSGTSSFGGVPTTSNQSQGAFRNKETKPIDNQFLNVNTTFTRSNLSSRNANSIKSINAPMTTVSPPDVLCSSIIPSTISSPFISQGPTITTAANLDRSFVSISTSNVPSLSVFAHDAKPASNNSHTSTADSSPSSLTAGTLTPMMSLPTLAKETEVNNPLFSFTKTSGRGLGGFPIGSKQLSPAKQGKRDSELPAELKQNLENFKKFIVSQKKLHEEVLALQNVLHLIEKIGRECQTLNASFSDLSNDLLKVQSQCIDVKNNVYKELSYINKVQLRTDHSFKVSATISDGYFENKSREFNSRLALFSQEVEVIESTHTPSSGSSKTLVDIIGNLDDEFISLAEKFHVVHERVKKSKDDYLRKNQNINYNNNPFLAIEGKFRDSDITTQTKILTRIGDRVGRSPFDNTSVGSQRNYNSTHSGILYKPPLLGSSYIYPVPTTANDGLAICALPLAPDLTLSLYLRDGGSNKK